MRAWRSASNRAYPNAQIVGAVLYVGAKLVVHFPVDP
jgi:hypothetical protein